MTSRPDFSPFVLRGFQTPDYCGDRLCHMSKGRRSSYPLEDVLKQLETGRAGATRVQAGSQPFHDRYNKAKAITDAIDDLAFELTGDKELFWDKGHG